MNSRNDEDEDWAERFIRNVLYPVVALAAPILLFVILIYLVFAAYGHGVAAGIRSTVGALIPAIVLIFMVKIYGNGESRRENRSRFWNRSPWLYLIAFFVVTIVILRLLTGSGTANEFAAPVAALGIKSPVPVVELVYSAALCLIIFSRLRIRDNKRKASISLGVVLGALFYVLLYGVPEIAAP
ncbi:MULTISPECIES: hypothetical protein [unclassified Nonomuraea]|uniref:hypothetical protein n=1 Tax=unclassified Nonomuraea TaxID=2593643 RepID=UPI0034089FC1